MIVRTTPMRPKTVDDLIDSRLMARLDRLDIRSRKLFPGKLQGERRSKKRGQSVEFDDYRPYVRGDDLRFIDWNVYARFDRLFIKLFLEEEDMALHIALDASASMDSGSPNKLMFASRLAMALGYIGLVNQNRVGISIFGQPQATSISRLPDIRGRHQVARLGKFLIDHAFPGRDVETATSGAPAPGADFNEALSTIARMRVGKGVMVVLSDFLIPDGYEKGLRSLVAAGGYDTYCLQLLSPGEIEPEIERESGLSGDVRLTDIETGRAAEITMTGALLRKYKQRLERYCADLASFCVARELTHMMVRSDASLETLLLDQLRRRGMVG